MPRIIKPTPGTFTTADITVDSSGRIIAASTGTAGGGNMVRTFDQGADGTATFTAQPGTSKLHLYIRGGGGGGGGGVGGQVGKIGGHGGFGFFNVPVSQPYSVPYTIGAGGSGGAPPNQTGQAGAASSFNTNLVANGGSGGGGAPGSAGSPGTLQNETYAFIDGNTASDSLKELFKPEGMTLHDPTSENTVFQNRADRVGRTNFNNGDSRFRIAGCGGVGGNAPNNDYIPSAYGPGLSSTPGRNGQSGGDGSIVIYEDIG
jgi:hypothetical protein